MNCHPEVCRSGIATANSCEACWVRRGSVCAALSSDELAVLASLAQKAEFAPKKALFLQGDRVVSVFNITSGVVRLYKLLADGRRQVIGFALPGDFLGLARGDAYDFSADAVDHVSACAFSRADYTALADAKPNLLRQLYDFAAHELALAQDQMVLLGRRTAEGKVICFLLRLQERWAPIEGNASVMVPLPMNRQDIADFLGLTIETVSRTFTRLARDKTILNVSHGVRLMNPDRMARIAAA